VSVKHIMRWNQCPYLEPVSFCFRRLSSIPFQTLVPHPLLLQTLYVPGRNCLMHTNEELNKRNARKPPTWVSKRPIPVNFGHHQLSHLQVIQKEIKP
jgi:hypothetical protein